MALFHVAHSLVVVLAIVVTSAQRPSHEEYKAKKASEAASSATVAAKDGKMAAVNKVVAMLEDLQKQVLEEGESEAKTYNTFACWVKTTQTAKQEAIRSGKDDKASLSAAIMKSSEDRKDLDTKIASLEKDISETNKAMKMATAESKSTLAEYEKNEADLSAALSSLNGAIKELKASKKPSLLQLQGVTNTIRQAMIMADALGLSTSSSSMLQADVPVDMENYKFHSDSVIETLEKLLTEFREEKNKVDKEEVSRVKAYQLLMQDKTDIVKAKTTRQEDAQKARSKAMEEIASNSQELSTTSATLLDDMEYMAEVHDISSQKAKTWDTRSKVRADELSALTAAIGIIKGTVADKTKGATVRFAQFGVAVHMADAVASSDSAMEAIEQSAEEVEDASPRLFLQRKHISRHQPAPADKVVEGQQKIVDLLRSKGKQLKSTLLSSLATEVASQGSADVFAKVKTLIQELVERLLAEAAGEANHQGWCNKAIQDAKQKRDHTSEDIATLNADLASEEAKRDKLLEELDEFKKDMAELKTGMTDAEKIRKEEKVENKNTVKEANEGLSAVQEAIKILTRFYATAAKATVSLSQTSGPSDDMPDAGFKAGEAYTGAGAEAGGVVGMLEVIEGDFVRTIKETEKAETQAEQDHLAFMTESGKSLAEKQAAHSQTTKYKDAAEAKLDKDGESLRARTAILKTSVEELLELQPACVDTGMSYQERVAHREEEVAALKKALCILNAYASYGANGLADSC